MTLLSRKVDYAIILLTHLARSPEGSSARELATTYQLSRPFTANILKQLCQEGLLESQRGVHGGYRLAKPAIQITLDMVVTSLEGPFRLVSCAEDGEEDNCEYESICPVRHSLRMVHKRVRATLAEFTLEDLRLAEQPLVHLEL